MSIVCGNTFILKPSERDPGAVMMLMEMLQEAGLPNGVVNVIHGTFEPVTFLCDHPDVKALSFVGSDAGVFFCIISFPIMPFSDQHVLTEFRENMYTNVAAKMENAFKAIWEQNVTES